MTKAEKIFIEAQRELKSGNYEKAFELHLQSAELGYAVSQSNVGYAYLHGQGVAQDYEKAVEWFRKAADQDNAPAMINLGYCYTKGFGVPQDNEEALNLFGRAAMLGSEQGQKNYDRLKKQLGIEAPEEETATEEAAVEEPAPESAPQHFPDAKKLVRKLIGADYTKILIALAGLILTFSISQIFKESLNPVLSILLWVVIVACFLLVALGISSIPGFRNASKCLNRLETLGLLDQAAAEIQYGDPQPFGLSGCITKHYIYGDGAIFSVDDILWVYPKEANKYISLMVCSKALPPMRLSGAAKNDRTGMIGLAVAALQAKNPDILSGHTAENKKLYEARREDKEIKNP